MSIRGRYLEITGCKQWQPWLGQHSRHRRRVRSQGRRQDDWPAGLHLSNLNNQVAENACLRMIISPVQGRRWILSWSVFLNHDMIIYLNVWTILHQSLCLLTLLLHASHAFITKFLCLFATRFRAINEDLRYYSQISTFQISITEILESLDYF